MFFDENNEIFLYSFLNTKKKNGVQFVDIGSYLHTCICVSRQDNCEVGNREATDTTKTWNCDRRFI